MARAPYTRHPCSGYKCSQKLASYCVAHAPACLHDAVERCCLYKQHRRKVMKEEERRKQLEEKEKLSKEALLQHVRGERDHIGKRYALGYAFSHTEKALAKIHLEGGGFLETEEQVRAAFNHLDVDEDGTLDKHNLRAMLTLMGQEVPKSPFGSSPELDAMFADLDENGDGKVTYDEFLAWHKRHFENHPIHRAVEAFNDALHRNRSKMWKLHGNTEHILLLARREKHEMELEAKMRHGVATPEERRELMQASRRSHMTAEERDIMHREIHEGVGSN